jgi:hypothetical protein
MQNATVALSNPRQGFVFVERGYDIKTGALQNRVSLNQSNSAAAPIEITLILSDVIALGLRTESGKNDGGSKRALINHQ